jgi:hypothetical protein
MQGAVLGGKEKSALMNIDKRTVRENKRNLKKKKKNAQILTVGNRLRLFAHRSLPCVE